MRGRIQNSIAENRSEIRNIEYDFEEHGLNKIIIKCLA